MQCVMLARYKGTPCPPAPHPTVWGVPLNFFSTFSGLQSVGNSDFSLTTVCCLTVDKLWHSLGGSFIFALEAATPCLSSLTSFSC